MTCFTFIQPFIGVMLFSFSLLLQETCSEIKIYYKETVLLLRVSVHSLIIFIIFHSNVQSLRI